MVGISLLHAPESLIGSFEKGDHMLAIRPHTREDYVALPDIDSPGIEHLDESDRRCLEEIGQTLVSSYAHKRFGVSLLHHHFAVRNDEVFVRSTDTTHRTITLQPRPSGFIKGDRLVPVNCAYSD